MRFLVLDTFIIQSPHSPNEISSVQTIETDFYHSFCINYTRKPGDKNDLYAFNLILGRLLWETTFMIIIYGNNAINVNNRNKQ